MKNVQKIDLGLTGYDELFANDEERKVNKLPRIFDIPISEIDDFPDHPFKVKNDEDMDQLVQSIKERGKGGGDPAHAHQQRRPGVLPRADPQPRLGI